MKFTKTNTSLKNNGFTLIELLVVITIISTLAVVVFVALNPGERLRDARDARRTSDVDSLLTAMHEYIIDNNSTYPAGLSTVEQQLGTAASGCAVATGGCTVTATACLDLSTPLATYLKSIPTDPTTGTAAETGYSAVVNSSGIVTIRACATEGTNNIYSSR
jgi:prepilin-type N-terminal cleavage/methylation domain-containing protein